MTRIPSLLLVGLLCACGVAPSSLHLTIADDSGPDLLATAQAAGARFEAASGVAVTFGEGGVAVATAAEVSCGALGPDAASCTHYRPRGPAALASVVAVATGLDAAERLAEGKPMAILVEPQGDPATLEALLLHELFHAAGARGVHAAPEDGASAFAPLTGPGAVITPADLHELCEAVPCSTFAPERE